MSDHSASGIASGLKFPEALTRSPRCFIALSGLDVLNNAVHRAVWDEFTTGGRRTERKPILYKNVPADHLYPKCCVHVREPLVRLCCCACVMINVAGILNNALHRMVACMVCPNMSYCLRTHHACMNHQRTSSPCYETQA